ncbi:MAG: 3-deoxy-D-manno-octulosonic acid transferase [Fusobacteria bacterium]|nr:3-deoxy-D-manno-octulosonic acid transferase [Fusobacteriota bacterium]
MASMGEVNLSHDLIKKIANNPNENILISVVTDTGYETAINKYKNYKNVQVIYFPLDDYFIIKNIVKKINIKKLILIETEIWPNLINIVSKKTKIILVNGRITEKSYKKYIKIKFFIDRIFNKIDIFLMQTEDDANRIRKFNIKRDKITVVGNLKFNIDYEKNSEDYNKNLIKKLNFYYKPIFIAGSTREGEEEIILEVYNNLEDDFNLIIAPRHIERVTKITKLISEKGYNYKKWSQLDEETDIKNTIIIVDEIGILRSLYQISDIVFVGGTLVNVGGHSLLEPLYYGKTPIFGKYTQNVSDIASAILKREIGYIVNNKEEFISAIKKIKNENNLKKYNIDKFFDEHKNVLNTVYNNIINL